MKTLLDAAKKAYPEMEWRIDRGQIRSGSASVFDISVDWPALQVALELSGWIFSASPGGEWFVARNEYSDPLEPAQKAKTKPELLLAIARQEGGE